MFASTFKVTRGFPWLSESASFDQEADFFKSSIFNPTLLSQSPIDASHQAPHDLRSNQCQRTGLRRLKPSETYPTNGQFIFSNLGVDHGKNRLVKTKLHLVAGAISPRSSFRHRPFSPGSDYDISKETPPPPPQPWCETPQTLEIRIGAPGFMLGVSGNTGVKGVVTSPDVSFNQIFSHLTHVPLYCRLIFAINDGRFSEMVCTWM